MLILFYEQVVCKKSLMKMNDKIVALLFSDKRRDDTSTVQKTNAIEISETVM